MKNYGLKKDGISFQEKSYISREVYVKSLESKAFGTMIGPFGGCYAIRKEYFIKVPANYLVDDFFICMNVLAQNKKAINNLEAIVYEDVSNVLSIEFKRKIRIAINCFTTHSAQLVFALVRIKYCAGLVPSFWLGLWHPTYCCSNTINCMPTCSIFRFLLHFYHLLTCFLKTLKYISYFCASQLIFIRWIFHFW